MAENTAAGAMLLDEPAMKALAASLAGRLLPPLVIYLEGELGAGKTTFARALIQGLGYEGRVKSPTFGLLEHYELAAMYVLHLDLYRLAEPGELEFLGIPDLLDSKTVLLVEWPERGRGFLPRPDLVVQLEHQDEARLLTCRAHSDSGKAICNRLSGISN